MFTWDIQDLEYDSRAIETKSATANPPNTNNQITEMPWFSQ